FSSKFLITSSNGSFKFSLTYTLTTSGSNVLTSSFSSLFSSDDFDSSSFDELLLLHAVYIIYKDIKSISNMDLFPVLKLINILLKFCHYTLIINFLLYYVKK